jgi:hypothetical protein
MVVYWDLIKGFRKRKNVFFLIFLLPLVTLSQSPSIGGYNVYYGSIHNHSNFSADAQGSAVDAYSFARDVSHLDFFGLSEHCIYLTQLEWDSLKKISAAANRDSLFTAFYGFEWTSSTPYGHLSVFETDSFKSVLDTAFDSFLEINSWIEKHRGLAFFNHPGRQNGSNMEFMHFESKPISNFVGMELWNRNNGFSVYYENDGYFSNDGNKSFYDEALLRGWRIGAEGAEDNHTANWGMYSDFRTAILAKANTKKDLLDAYWNRRFYSTLDKNLVLSFSLENHEMGDSAAAGKLNLKITAFDVDSEMFTSVVLKRNGDTLKTWTINAKNVSINDSIECTKGEYYYVIITQQDGNQAISSPIFISEKIKESIVDTVVSIDTTSHVDSTKTAVNFLHHFVVKPNPFLNKIEISNDLNQDVWVSIYSLSGEVVLPAQSYASSSISIVTNHLVTGCYILKIVNKNSCEQFKLFKK